MKSSVVFLTSLLLAGIVAAQGEPIQAKGYAALNAEGKLVPHKFNRRAVGDRDLLVEILYCGICHSDVHEAFNDWGFTSYPVVPGHEMVGRVLQTGKQTTRFKSGEYIGIGATLNSCGQCAQCKAHKEQYCANVPVDADSTPVGIGGYSDKIVIHEDYGVKIPADAPLEKLGPIMCAGITVYSPLKAAKLTKGDKVVIAGFGGLGHLAVQYAVAFGAEVTVFDRTEAKRELAAKLGAIKYINTANPPEMEGMNGTFDYILTTIPTHYDPVQYLNMLKVGGELMIVGLPPAAEAPLININAIPFGVKISKWMMGGIAETQEAMDFSLQHKIYPMVEVTPIQKVNEAFQNVKEGKVHFRYTIDMKTLK